MASLRSWKLVLLASLFAGGSVGLAHAAKSAAPDAAAPLSTPAGVGALVDAQKDLPFKKDFAVNSWFITGHVKTEGHTLSYLYHVMITPSPDGKPIIQSVTSITDETTGWYRAGDIVLPYTGQGASADGLNFTFDNGEMRGTRDALHVKAMLKDASLDVQMHPTSPTLYNGGTGMFPLLGMVIQEYSVPVLKATGTITIEGKSYKVDGDCWFDRQWQNPAVAGSPMAKWSWMGLHLDNGDAISLWSAFDGAIGKNRAWATILHHDGSQTVTAVEPSLGATDEWTSPQSGNRYPTRWSVSIPALNAKLGVVPAPRQQEIISVAPYLTKYEGASKVSGTYGGKPIKGFGYVELIGAWK
ncbi:lipocalin family protein [Pleomorphomonas sp. PLEO]|uniref:lipocalin family protein n=1 Tax=Pleomorphomonas sp. PLEO TaxID=3239306 RepID=UPI00351EB4E3